MYLKKRLQEALEPLEKSSFVLVPKEDVERITTLEELCRMGLVAKLYHKETETEVAFVRHYEHKEVVVSDALKAWHQGPPESPWRLCMDKYGGVTAESYIETTRERVEDWSGRSKYRVMTRHNVRLVVRVYGGEEVTINDIQLTGGLKAVLKEMLEWGREWIMGMASFEAGVQASKIELDTYDRFTAQEKGYKSWKLLSGDDCQDYYVAGWMIKAVKAELEKRDQAT